MKLSLQRELHVLYTAVSFLTRIPVPEFPFRDEYLSAAARYSPLVGALVGTIGAGVYAAATLLWPPEIAVALCLATTVYVTGAFHEDGFADFCDGFGGGWTKERILEIMKDSRTGAYGVVGAALMLLVRWAGLVTLAQHHVVVLDRNVSLAICALVGGHSISRFFSATYIYTHEYVRENEDSRAKPMAKSMTGLSFLFAAVTTSPALLLLPLPYYFAAVPLLIFYVWFGRLLVRRIGGYTGDCLGAAQQISEALFYLSLAAVARHISA